MTKVLILDPIVDTRKLDQKIEVKLKPTFVDGASTHKYMYILSFLGFHVEKYRYVNIDFLTLTVAKF